jgi:hypothetical protein
MKVNCLKHYASVAAMAALLPLGAATSQGASVPTTLEASDPAIQQPEFSRVEWVEEKRHKLRHAYWLLEQADRDYGGHRTKAMEEIKKAGDIIGLDLHGEGYGGEHQKWSDERLREAKHLLDDVVEKSGGREHEHIRFAIREINKALDVR